MIIKSIIRDSVTGKSLAKAKVFMYLGERKLGEIYSRLDGTFSFPVDDQSVGETLTCKVEKDGYKIREVTRKIESDEVLLEDIELDPIMDELRLSFKDNEGNPLKNVNITIESDGDQVGVGISDKNGVLKIMIMSDLKGKTLNYKAELRGFGITSGKIRFKEESSHEITMKKDGPIEPHSRKKWPIIVGGVVGLVIIAAIIIIPRLVPHNPTPVAGIWDSDEFGKIYINESEASNKVTGVMVYHKGLFKNVAFIMNGTRQGNKLEFKYKFALDNEQKLIGEITLYLSSDGKTLSGTFTNPLEKPVVIRKLEMEHKSLEKIGGVWNLAGSGKYYIWQEGIDVEAVLLYTNGATATIEGTFKNNKLDGTWWMTVTPNTKGTIFLELSADRNKLSGMLNDELEVKLTRLPF